MPASAKSYKALPDAKVPSSDDADAMKKCFAPVVDENVRLLILGSLPGERSLVDQQYYAHPQNKFWELVGNVIGHDLRNLSYTNRLQLLLQKHVGLWDVIAQAERVGSLDAAIRRHTGNALQDLVLQLPHLRAIAFNGATAAKLGRKQMGEVGANVELLDLPSSSPAYTLALAEKMRGWSVLRQHLLQ